VFHLTAGDYPFFSVAHETSSKIDHIIRPKRSLNIYTKKRKNFKKREKNFTILIDHNGIKLHGHSTIYILMISGSLKKLRKKF
jgi:hypothetical protein